MYRKNNIIYNKSFEFAIEIVNRYKMLANKKKEFVMSKQILRSGTSVGANVREADNAESKADFIHKMSIAQKEADESIYWLELLYRTYYIEKETFEPRNFTPQNLEGASWMDKNIFNIKLRIDESLRDIVMERCDEDSIVREDDNKLIVDLPFVDDEYAYNFLLSLGNKCECLEPKFVRDKLANKIQKMLENYNR